jgi:uncharacterized membrane protein
MYGQNVYWRETMKNGKFLIFEGRVVFVLLPTFMHLRLWTLTIAILTMFMFWWFDRKGISANAIARYLKAKLIGKKRSARGVFEERTAVDFSFETKIYLQQARLEALQASAPEAKKGFLAMFGFGKKAKPDTADNLSLRKEV